MQNKQFPAFIVPHFNTGSVLIPSQLVPLCVTLLYDNDIIESRSIYLTCEIYTFHSLLCLGLEMEFGMHMTVPNDRKIIILIMYVRL